MAVVTPGRLHREAGKWQKHDIDDARGENEGQAMRGDKRRTKTREMANTYMIERIIREVGWKMVVYQDTRINERM